MSRRGHGSVGGEAGAIRIRLLGGFRVSVGDSTVPANAWRLRKAASLVKLLALAPKHRLHREQAMDVLWPDLGKKAASNNLRQALHATRRALGPVAGSRYLTSEDEVLVLCPEGHLWVDVESFEEAAATARRARDPAAYRAALELYAGDLLPEDRYEEWAEVHRRRLREIYLSLLLEFAHLYEESSEHKSAAEVLRQVVEEEPLREEAHVGLMRLDALSGRKREALAHYERLEEALREAGAKPAASSSALREEIASGRCTPHGAGDRRALSEEPTSLAKHNLPAQRSSFVGREREMLEVKRELAMTRLLTLTGTGGSGKTRFALEIARDLLGAYPDGVWMVELAPLSEPRLVSQEIASTLKIREQPGRPLVDTLVDALRNRKMLLVVDNCEHLIDACASLVDTLLDACSRLRVLATSREALRVAGETSWPVPSLTVPEAGEDSPAVESLMRYEAIRLFVERAHSRLPSFALTPENARVVGAICRKLDGIPLAIELAAARVPALDVGQIAGKLEDSLELLTAGGRTTDLRHQTLRATLDWSYDLLGAQERGLFGRFSVFAGGWTLEAAGAVGKDEDIHGDSILDLLSTLVGKSLVVAEAGPEGAQRYRMLEPVRQYAQERLVESGEVRQTRKRHAEYYLALAERARPELRGPRQVAWLELLETEHDNLRAALSWSLGRGAAQPGGRAPHPGVRLAAALWRFWEAHGHMGEGRRWLEAALSESRGPSVARAEALNGAGWMALFQGDHGLAITWLEESIALFKELGDKAGAANSLTNLGLASLHGGDKGRVAVLREEAEVLRREPLDRRATADLLVFLGMVAIEEGDYDQVVALNEEGLALSRGLGDVRSIAQHLTILWFERLNQGDHERALVLLEECMRLTAHEMTHELGIAYNLLGLAGVAALRGQPLRAARLWGAAEALREAIGQPLSPYDYANYDYEGYLDIARSRSDEVEWEAAWSEGRAMPLAQAVQYALGGAEVPTTTAAAVTEKPSSGGQAIVLTRREKEIAALVAQGLTNRRIAAELSLSERTVENHISNILKKLNLSSREHVASRLSC